MSILVIIRIDRGGRGVRAICMESCQPISCRRSNRRSIRWIHYKRVSSHCWRYINPSLRNNTPTGPCQGVAPTSTTTASSANDSFKMAVKSSKGQIFFGGFDVLPDREVVSTRRPNPNLLPPSPNSTCEISQENHFCSKLKQQRNHKGIR